MLNQGLDTTNLCFCNSGVMVRRSKSKNMMLQQFTWQQFLVAVLILSLVWYTGVILIFYRRELKALLGGNRRQQEKEPLPHRWQKEVEILEEENSDEMIGRSKMPEGMENVGVGGFGFVNDNAKEAQVGLVPDVLQEIKKVFRNIAERDGNKKDFFRLMETVRGNYPQISSHPSIGHINGFISENVPFHLSPDELENLWN